MVYHTPTIELRSARVTAALNAYMGALADEGDDPQGLTRAETAQDLVTDIMHFCDQNRIDFDVLRELADDNYRDEVEMEMKITEPINLV